MHAPIRAPFSAQSVLQSECEPVTPAMCFCSAGFFNQIAAQPEITDTVIPCGSGKVAIRLDDGLAIHWEQSFFSNHSNIYAIYIYIDLWCE